MPSPDFARQHVKLILDPREKEKWSRKVNNFHKHVDMQLYTLLQGGMVRLALASDII